MRTVFQVLNDTTQDLEGIFGLRENKSIQQAGSARHGKHLLLRGRVLYHVLVFEAERARYEGRLGDEEEIRIGLKTLSEAIADRDNLFCLVTQTDGAQQVPLAPATDVDGWENVTAVLHLTGDLPFPKAQQQDYLGSLANIIMLGYRSR